MTQIKSDPRVHNRPKPVKVEEKADAKEAAPKVAPKRGAPKSKG